MLGPQIHDDGAAMVDGRLGGDLQHWRTCASAWIGGISAKLFPVTGARPRGTHGQLAVSCTVSHGLEAGGLLGWRSRVLDGQSIVMGRRGDNW